MARPQPTTAEWTILAGAGATFLGSFLDAAGGANAWGSGSFSVLKLVPIYAVTVGGVVAIRRYLAADLPERVGPFTWAAATGGRRRVRDAHGRGVGGRDRVARGVGLWVMTAGSLVMTIGTVADERAARRRLHLYSPPAPRKEHLTTGNVVILVAGAVMILGSFLAFWTLERARAARRRPVVQRMGSVVLLPRVGDPGAVRGRHDPRRAAARGASRRRAARRFFGFTWDQVYYACATQAAVMMLAFAIEGHPGFQLGTGFYLMLLAGVALVAGTVMRSREGSAAY